jgi:hypothetical protein
LSLDFLVGLDLLTSLWVLSKLGVPRSMEPWYFEEWWLCRLQCLSGL